MESLPSESTTPVSIDLENLYPFALDDFQQAAIAALNAGQSVVVSAPTGSGKTLVGEHAIALAQASHRRVFYTTPLKALSNQKFRDFQQQFGPEQVGLLTGDVSVHRDANILVMTTEIFRNILYGTLLEDVTSLDDVGYVILDECHYMNDRQRGTVWEESIIYCPPHIQLIALSATIANADELTDWISWVHGPTQLITSTNRPVPLRFSFVTANGFYPLLNPQQNKINQKLRVQSRNASTKKQKRSEIPAVARVVRQLHQRDLLPAIYFIFSRKRCEQALQQISHLNLVSDAEALEIERRVRSQLRETPKFAKPAQLKALRAGIASHHAGLLPLWKSFVEELFQLGLIKVVFATETLAAGINMPARTTVISSLSKRTDTGHRLLNPSEFLQMSGRAGRRGLDPTGYVITQQTAFEGARDAAYLAMAESDPLVSQFTPSYGMVLNLLQTHSFPECQELIEKSFGQYLALENLTPQQQAIQMLEQDYQNLKQRTADHDFDEIHQYQKLQQRLKVEKKLLKTLHLQAEDVQSQTLAQGVDALTPGTIVGLRLKTTKHQSSNDPVLERLIAYGIDPPQSAVIIRQLPSAGQLPYFLCLSIRNTWHIAPIQSLVAIADQRPLKLPASDFEPPTKLTPKPGRSCAGSDASQPAAQSIPVLNWSPAPEVIEQMRRVEELQQRITNHPAHAYYKQHANILRLERRLQSIDDQLQDRRKKLVAQTQGLWREFLAIVDMLQASSALTQEEIQPLGKVAAQLRGENELWLAMVFTSGLCDPLPPHQLAAVVAAVITDLNRTDTRVNLPTSPEVFELIRALRPQQKSLMQQQYRRRITCPVCLNQDLIALVEHWSLGLDWDELCLNTSLDEGDIVRIIRRTLDVLTQITHVNELNKPLKQNATRAKGLIERFPIQETLAGQ
ncbi:MAG: DEAD/DEAH box helicase [Cyanobacteria bacterium P01_F01_bin.42]